VVEQAMAGIAARPRVVVDRAVAILEDRKQPVIGAKVLVLGVAYKPGVRDVRESPAIEIIEDLRRRGAVVSYADPLVPELRLSDGSRLHDERDARHREYSLILVHTLHPGVDHEWVLARDAVLDATHRLQAAVAGSQRGREVA
jgi:UDP-N-acetyl-D-glucosamine dehydrogenase